MSRIVTESIDKLKDNINILDVVGSFIELSRKGSSYKACCPFHGEKTPSFIVRENRNSYKCYGCGEGGDAIDFVMKHEKLAFIEAVKVVADIVNFELEYEDRKYKPRRPIIVTKSKTKTKEKSYDLFNPSLKKDANLVDGFLKFNSLPLKYRMMLVYSAIYKFSLEQNQFEKYEYFARREVNLKHPSILKLGYIPVDKFEELTDKLIYWFGLDVLVELGVLNDEEHKVPHSFKLWYVKEGGLIVFPSFHIYQTNLVTSFMFRPTKPEQWMIDSHMKEIQMSNHDLFSSVPYGLTYDFIENKNAIKCLVEGGPDTLCNSETYNGKDFLFIGSPGTSGLREEHLYLLKGQSLRIMLDPDEAGRMATYGSVAIHCDKHKAKRFARDKEGLEALELEKKYLDLNNIKYFESNNDGYIQKCIKAGVTPEVCSWDPAYGDLNDIRKLALSGKAPFKTMEEFFEKFVSVKRFK